MRALKTRFALIGLAALGLLIAGCLVSGTFIIVDDFQFTAQSGFYYYRVDITDNKDWQEHKDEIDDVDAVGAEFFITSEEEGPVTFSVYIDDYTPDGEPTPNVVPATATVIIDSLVVNPGKHHMTYAQSLKIIVGTARLKALAKTGRFDYFGISSGNLGETFRVDSAKVICTVTAG